MRAAIVYSSETGFTRKYALGLQGKLGGDAKVLALKEALKMMSHSYDICDKKTGPNRGIFKIIS